MYVTAGVWVVCVCATKVEVVIIIGGIYTWFYLYVYVCTYERGTIIYDITSSSFLLLLLLLYQVFIAIGLT